MTVTVDDAQPKPRAARDMINAVARSVGKENNATARREAMEYINAVADELNTFLPWMSLRAESLANPFTASTASYTLATDVYRVEKVWITDTTDDATVSVVELVDYAQRRDWDPLNDADVCSIAVVQSTHAPHEITFYGTPTAAEASGNEYNYSYFARVPLIATEADVLNIPREFDRVLVEGGKYLMRDNSPTADEGKTQRTFANYMRLLKRLRDADRNMPAERPRWRISGRRGTFGTMLIRV